MRPVSRKEDRSPRVRKTDERRRTHLQLEPLEDRELLSWMSVPPAHITPPSVTIPGSVYLYSPVLNTQGDAHGTNHNLTNEVDYYRFTASANGSYQFDAKSPGHMMDTVIAVYDAAGNRLGYNDDIAPGDTDSEVSVNLVIGKQYYFGVTNYYAGIPTFPTTHGAYNWSIDGPNNDRDHALDLGHNGVNTTLTGLQMWDRNDWFSFSGTSAHVQLDSSLAPAPDVGDLDLYLYRRPFNHLTSPFVLVGSSTSATNHEDISIGDSGAFDYLVEVRNYRTTPVQDYSLSVHSHYITRPIS